MPLLSWIPSAVRRLSARLATTKRVPAVHTSVGPTVHAPAPLSALPEPATARTPAARPLRVWRVVDSRASVREPGRLVMAGRLADVCAELDRLAALEAATA